MKLGGVLSLVLAVELRWALLADRPRRVQRRAAGPISSVAAIGAGLFTTHAFAFEVTSILILVAMVGAVVIAGKEP